MRIHKFWRRLTTSRHARTLETELARERAANAEQGIEITRLRAENRALLNSILGIAGIPPLPATEADLAAVQSSLYSGTGTPACAPSSRHYAPDLGSHATSHPPSHSRNEKIDAIYLSPDAFARRTDEASIADQMGDVFAAAGFPRPIPADNDRIGGWMLMYQMLDADEWLLTDNCIELIRTIPTLVRDMARIEDIEKMDGDDPADAARYGLKSRYATRAAYSIEHLPYEARLAARILSADPTVRAIQARKAQLEEHRRTKFVPRRGR
jgi:hypothetical protein